MATPTTKVASLWRRRQHKSFASIFALFVAIQITSRSATVMASTIFEDYAECRDHEMFGNLSLICDAEHKLQRTTLRSLDSLLRDLQNKILCDCANGCARGEGRSDKYIGLLVVTTTAKIDATAAETAAETASANSSKNAQQITLNATARRIYEDARLGNDVCDNGLLILYIKDQQKLATYRGSGRFALLNDDDMKRLYQLAHKSTQSPDSSLASDNRNGDSVALQYLLSNYNDRQSADGGVLRAESWAPIVGLTLALLIILLILAALFAFLLARLCCCCCKRKADHKDKYYVSPHMPATYKTIEPIYIVTPPVSEHGGGVSSLTHPSHYQRHHHYSHHYGNHHDNHRHSLYLPQQASPSSMMNGGIDYSVYSSSYGGIAGASPIPPPPPPLPPLGMYDVGNPIITHPPRSRSITPTSMHRTRINPQRSTSSTRDSQIIRLPESAHSNKCEKMNRQSILASAQSSSTTGAGTYYVPPGYGAGSQGTEAVEWHRPHNSQTQSARGNDAHSTASRDAGSESGGEHRPSLPFLDPNRKREVQTKREFIT